LRHASVSPRPPARLARRGLQRLGLHPVDTGARTTPEITGRRALVVCTNHGVLDVGKPTGVFASEMTAPFYVMADAGMRVDVASPRGGTIPVDPLSLQGAVRCAYDDRFLKDHELRAAVGDSLAVGEIDVADYDLVYLAGGWGAAFDFATSEELAAVVTRADRLGLAIGGVCHGPLGLLGATTADGRPLVEGRRLTAVTDKQVRELGISSTPWHPEAELRTLGARFEARHRLRDVLANHWVLDGNLVTGQNQNAAPMVARELVQLVARS
jgi:putative intracellular protease/amidase